MDPMTNKKLLNMMGEANLEHFSQSLRATTPDQPVVKQEYMINHHGDRRWMQIIARTMWTSVEPRTISGAIGKVVDIHDERLRMDELEQMASHDTLTGLYNHNFARHWIRERMEQNPDGKFALAILDLDYFKSANDQYGHMFGDQVLTHVADLMKRSIRGGDITARVGGDEFLIFLEYRDEAEPVVDRIYESLTGKYEDFKISISMGVAKTEMVGINYDTLFHAADQALYAVKRSGRGHYRFYDDTMQDILSAISPIDGEEETR